VQVSAVLTSAQMLQSCPKSQLSLARQLAAPVGQARSDTTTMQSAVRKLMREVPLVLPGHSILLLWQTNGVMKMGKRMNKAAEAEAAKIAQPPQRWLSRRLEKVPSSS
jgi:hypothetical protein